MDKIWGFLASDGDLLLVKTWEHLYISFAALFLGVLVAVPLGILLARLPKIAGFVMGVAGVDSNISEPCNPSIFYPTSWNR